MTSQYEISIDWIHVFIHISTLRDLSNLGRYISGANVDACNSLFLHFF